MYHGRRTRHERVGRLVCGGALKSAKHFPCCAWGERVTYVGAYFKYSPMSMFMYDFVAK